MDTDQYFMSLHKDLDSLDEEFRRSLELLTEDELNWKPAPDSWSVAECLDHLIITGRRYVSNINRKADKLGTLPKSIAHKPFKPGWTAKLFAKWMEPGERKSKIKAPANFQPSNSRHSMQIIEDFLTMHSELQESINKVKEQQIANKAVTSPITSLIRFKLGDVFLMLFAHERRHLAQVERVKQHMYEESGASSVA